VVLRLTVDTNILFFFHVDSANLSSLRRAGDESIFEIALIKANFSCFSITPQQEHRNTIHWSQFLQVAV
jgi:hypothetical protein